jgi:hypothetical protein
MGIEELPSNSHSKQPRVNPASKKTVEKVVTGKVLQRRMPLGKRFMQTFVAEDADSVGRYILMDVLIPAFKDVISDVVSQAVDRTLFGGNRNGPRRSGLRGNTGGPVSYNRYASSGGSIFSRQQPRDERPTISRRARGSHDFDEIVLATRTEADEVIDRLFDLISQYEQATVSDLYELVGLEAKFTDERWGWRELKGAGVSRVNGGYLLDLPKPEQLD